MADTPLLSEQNQIQKLRHPDEVGVLGGAVVQSTHLGFRRRPVPVRKHIRLLSSSGSPPSDPAELKCWDAPWSPASPVGGADCTGPSADETARCRCCSPVGWRMLPALADAARLSLALPALPCCSRWGSAATNCAASPLPAVRLPPPALELRRGSTACLLAVLPASCISSDAESRGAG